MPQIVINVTTENGLRVVAALEYNGFARLDDESDIAYATRYARLRFIGLVHVMDSQAAANAVAVDEAVVT